MLKVVKSILYSQRCLVLIPNLSYLVVKILIEWVSLSEGEHDAFEILWVGLDSDGVFGISDQVVVELNSSWFLLLDHDFPDLEEEVRDF